MKKTTTVTFSEAQLDTIRDLIARTRDHAKGALDVYNRLLQDEDLGEQRTYYTHLSVRRELGLIATCDLYLSLFDEFLEDLNAEAE